MSIVSPRKYLKAIDCGNTVVYRHCPFEPPTEARIKRIDADHYVVKSTAELRRYSPRSETKGDNLHSVHQSFNRLKSVINANVRGNERVRFLTLTYAENMTDNKRISRDMAYFFKKLKAIYGPMEYLYVKERQARGAWHMHCVLFFDGPAPYMPNTEDDHPVRDAWGHGFVNVQGFSGDINNLGNYLCAYLTDDDQLGKKGARLANYESGIRLYNCSRGISRPRESRVSWDDYVQHVTSPNVYLVSEGDSSFIDGDGRPAKVVNQIFIER